MFNNYYFKLIIGITLGLMVTNQSIRTLFHTNLIMLYFAVLLLFFFWK